MTDARQLIRRDISALGVAFTPRPIFPGNPESATTETPEPLPGIRAALSLKHAAERAIADCARHAREDGHARKHGPGPPESTKTSDLDQFAATGASEGGLDLAGGLLGIGRNPAIGPRDHVRRPRRSPPLIHVQPERTRRVVLTTLADRGHADACAVWKSHVHNAG